MMVQIDDNLLSSEKTEDIKFANDDLEMVQPLEGCPILAVGSIEDVPTLNTVSQPEKRWRKVNKVKMEVEVLSMDQALTDVRSAENILKGNSDKRKRQLEVMVKKAKIKDESQSIDQTDGLSILCLSDALGFEGKLIENDCAAQESEYCLRKESSISVPLPDKVESCNDEETIELSHKVEVSSSRISSELGEIRSGLSLELKGMKGKLCSIEIQHSPCPSQIDSGNSLFTSDVSESNNATVVDEGKCSAEGRNVISTCPIEMATNLSFPDGKESECFSNDLEQYPGIAPGIVCTQRKLLVLDLNGLLACIVTPPPEDCKGDTHMLGRAIFRRPFCDDFLKFCFENFDVGVWSSRSKRIVDKVVDYLLGDLRDRLKFCWDMAHCTQTGFNTLENIHKPMVFKELRKIWENDDPNSPWRKGDYDESNTLLLDDSPYKALLNPLHTAIFPNSYHYEDKNDNSLGPGGDLRVYLEGMLSSEHIQKYVKQHPFGQSAISETNLSWDFYFNVIQTMLNQPTVILHNNRPPHLGWIAPPRNSWKLNINGSSDGNPGPAGVGGVLRNHSRNVTMLFFKHVGWQSAINAEMLAVVTGLEHIRISKFRRDTCKLIIESESTSVISWLSVKVNRPKKFTHLFSKIDSFLQSFRSVEFRRAYDEHNHLAEGLAEQGLLRPNSNYIAWL